MARHLVGFHSCSRTPCGGGVISLEERAAMMSL